MVEESNLMVLLNEIAHQQEDLIIEKEVSEEEGTDSEAIIIIETQEIHQLC